MERVKRRWWTWAVSLIAVAVIAGAALSGAFQLAVLAVPSYREDLAAWVGEVTGRPVQIGGISLAWRGLAPRMDLSGITLYSADGSEELRLDRLSLGVGLRRLLMGKVMPTRLEISGLRISAEIDEQGRIRVAGFEPDQPESASVRREQWLDDLERFEHVSLENCELRLLHASFEGVPLNLRIDSIELDKTERGFEIGADLRLPADRGGELHLDAEIEGPVAELRSWKGRFEASFESLQPQGWLRPWLLPGTQIATRELDGRITGEIGEGRLMRARIELGSGTLVLARAGVLSSALQSTAILDYTRNPRGWRIDVTDLSFDDTLLLRGSLRYDRLDGQSAYDLDADQLGLTRLAPWVGVWRDAPDWAQIAGRGTGDVEGLVVRYRTTADTPRYSVRARLHGLGLHADRTFGFARLDGELSADETGGQLQLSNTPLALELPAALEEVVAFDAVDADLRWSRDVDGWRVFSEGFGWRLASLEGHGRFELQLPQEKESAPLLDLRATFAAQDVNDARAYMPRRWPASLKSWLAQGIVAARVSKGELSIRGPITDFPFHKHPTGAWRLDLDAADAELNYAPGWPHIRDIRAHLLFQGNSLVITADQADIGGNRVVSAEVRFDDFDERLLAVSGAVEGELARYYKFLRSSPLHKPLKGLLDNTQATGGARVDLQLRMPVDHVADTAVYGQVAVADAQLHYGALQPITGLRGTLAFTERGVTAESLHGQFEELPLDLRIDAQEGTRGVVRGTFPFAPRADGNGASQFVPEFLRGAMSGSSQWQMELPLRDSDTALYLRSSLAGTAVDLPAPLGKPADTSAPVQLRIGGDAQLPLRVDVGYDSRIGVSVAVARTDAGWGVVGLHGRLGADQAPAARSGSFRLDGHMDRLEPAAWVGVLAGGDGDGDGDGGTRLRLDTADIETERLAWRSYVTRPARLQYRPTSDGWLIDLSGEGAVGRVQYRPDEGGRISAELDRLQFAAVPPTPAVPLVPDAAPSSAPQTPAPPAQTTAPVEPSKLPTIDLICEQLSIGDAGLGRVELSSSRVPGGQALRRLRMRGGIADVDASGAWRRIGGQSSGELRFELDARDIDKLLVGFGYAASIDAKRSHFTGELGWAPAAEGLRWEMATGGIHVGVDDGQLRAVQPGASRVLGLINFYALPRRLTLNFDDVVGKGLAFDRILGKFALADGNATTDDLRIDGPSLRMDIRGKVGLAARDYDQRVTVYPDVSSGVTLGAVLLGGPAVGALVLLAQELLDKPLDQVTQFSYRITGPWDNPKVERLDAQTTQPGY